MATPSKPLAGVRILDFGRAIAVPFATQPLAWLGAEVILIESIEYMTNRHVPPFADAVQGVNRSGGFNLFNTDKLSLTLDLKKKDALEMVRELVAISDVVTENLPTGAMEKLGLGYDDLRKINPTIVYLSVAAFGRTGPLKDFVGFHSVVNLFGGLSAVTGYPGGHPRILGGFFPDFLGASYATLGLLEALHHRQRTGKGQHIEVSMTEALTTMLPEQVADFSLHGREPERIGNHDTEKAPHHIYRCAGNQQWLSISVANDDEWARLADAMSRPDLATDPRFATRASRLSHQDELDALISAWTKDRDVHHTAALLQQDGVAAFPALDSREVLQDKHLRSRGFVADVTHPEVGARPMGTTAWLIDGKRPDQYAPAPLLGQHNAYVVSKLLSRSSDEAARIKASGVLGSLSDPKSSRH